MRNLLLPILLITISFLGCEKSVQYEKGLLLSKVSLKVINYTELNNTLHDTNYVIGTTELSEENIFPKESYNIEEDIFIHVIYEVNSLDSTIFAIPVLDKLTLICPNDLNISYHTFDNNYFKNSLSFFASTSQLKILNCLNLTSQDINLTSIYTATVNTSTQVSVITDSYTSNIVTFSTEELNEAFALYQESLDE